jgi:hypothetical protein
MEVLTFAVVLRRMCALPKLLLLIARLGGAVRYVSAADGRATLVVGAPQAAAHRFAPQLRRIVDVVELQELRMVGRLTVNDGRMAERRRKPA